MSRTQHCRQPWELSGIQRLELGLYRCLGVELFRRLVFAVEALRRRRSGGRNQNYHLDRLTAAGAEEYSAYLLYHTVLHTASLLLLVPVVLYRRLRGLDWDGVDLLVGLMFVFNIWCILLQRYNWLRLTRLRRHREAVQARRLERRLPRLLAVLPGSGVQEGDLALAEKMHENLSRGEDVFLGEGEAPALLRLAELLEQAGLLSSRALQREELSGELTLERLADRCALELRPCSRLEARVDRIQRLLLPGRRTLLSRCAVITEDARTEEAFSRLFARSAPEGITQTLLLLTRARQAVGEG